MNPSLLQLVVRWRRDDICRVVLSDPELLEQRQPVQVRFRTCSLPAVPRRGVLSDRSNFLALWLRRRCNAHFKMRSSSRR